MCIYIIYVHMQKTSAYMHMRLKFTMYGVEVKKGKINLACVSSFADNGRPS